MSRTIPISERKTKVISNLLSAFANRTCLLDHMIRGFKVDLFFVDYNLAVHGIDYTSKTHRLSQIVYMEKIIPRGLSCRFITYDVTNPNFDIFSLINRILIYMERIERLSSSYVLSSGRIESLFKTNKHILEKLEKLENQSNRRDLIESKKLV